MRVRGEIVFPNNIKQLRIRKQLTQAQLDHLMEPPVAGSTISKIESGECRPTNLQLGNFAALLGCPPDAIPVVAIRDPSQGVRYWQHAQEEVVRHSILSGAAAAGYVLAQLRKKSGKTMQQVAGAIGMTLSVYHRVEMATRMIQADEIEAVAKLYGINSNKLVGLFERRTHDNLVQLEKGVRPEQLLPRTPRALLKEDARWAAWRPRTLRHAPQHPLCAPVPPADAAAGIRKDDGRQGRHAPVCHRSRRHGRPHRDRRISSPGCRVVPCAKFLAPAWFPIEARGRLPMSIRRRRSRLEITAFLVRRDGSAEAGVVISEGLGPLKLKMYNPEEEIPIEGDEIAAVLRIRMVIMP